MIKKEAIFMDCFDEDIRQEIREFGKRITKISQRDDIDIIILMARKAVCFIEALRLLGLTKFRCLVISNRVLDMNCDWLRGQRVAVIDDAVITGTTLHSVEQKLIGLGCAVEVHVLCVDETHWQKELVDPEEPKRHLPSDRVASLCADIVTAISLLPVPYATDYPLYRELKVSRHTLEDIVGCDDWSVYDSSTVLQDQYNVFSLVIEPKQETLVRLSEEIGLDMKKGGLYKIRIYGRWANDERQSCFCTIHPIVAFEPMKCTCADHMFDHIIKGSEHHATLKEYFVGQDKGLYCGRLRLIQYFLAARIASFWARTVNVATFDPIMLSTTIEYVHYLFPPPIYKELATLFREAESTCFPPEQNEFFGSPFEDNYIYEEPINLPSINPWSVKQSINQRFVDLFDDYEIELRRLAEEYGVRLYKDPVIRKKYEKNLMRLEHGFSLCEMNHWLHDDVTDESVRSLVISHYLDQAIDKGIAVPTTCVRNGWVFRGYRHGEDVQFGKEEKDLTFLVLSSYFREKGAKTIPGIEVEKLGVLLIKKMLASGMREVADATYPTKVGNDIIGVRFSLHGAVVARDCEKIYQAPGEYCFRSLLKHSQMLEPVSGGEEKKSSYKLKQWNVSKASSRRNEFPVATQIGGLLGELRSRANKKKREDRLSQNELILLATVMSPQDLCLALAAEHNLACSAFNDQLNHFQHLVDDLGRLTHDDIKSFRGVANRLSVALSSGTWKFRSVVQNDHWKVINRIARGLKNEDYIRAGLWETLWPNSLKKDISNCEPELKELLCSLAVWVSYARLLFADFCVAGTILLLRNKIPTKADRLCQIIAHNLPKKWHDLTDAQRKSYIDKCCLEGAGLDEDEHSSHFGLIRDFTVSYFEVKDSFYLIETAEKYINESVVFISDDIRKSFYEIRRSICEGAYVPDVQMKKALSEFERITAYKDSLLPKTDIVAGGYGKIQKLYEYRNILVIEFLVADQVLIKSIEAEILSLRATFKKARNLQEVSIRVHSETNEVNKSVRLYVLGYSQVELNFILSVLNKHYALCIRDDVKFWLLVNLPSYLRILSSKMSNSLEKKMFNRFLETIMHSPELSKGELNVICPSDFKVSVEVIPKIGDQFKAIFGFKDAIPSEIEKEYGFDFKVYRCGVHANYREGKNMESQVDIGIITVVPDERRAVIDHLSNYEGFRDFHTGMKSGRTFTLGSLPCAEDQFHSVAMVQCLDQGNPQVGPVYADLKKEFNPRVIFLLGICGAKHEKLGVGDVGMVSHVIAYEPGAVTDSGSLHDHRSYAGFSESIKQLFEDCQSRHSEDLEFEASDGSPNYTFKVRKALLVSGEKTVRADNAELIKWLDGTDRRGYLIDKESVGFLEACNAEQLNKENPLGGFGIIRVVSDSAGSDKTKEFRYEIVKNAMTFLEALCQVAQKGFEGRI